MANIKRKWDLIADNRKDQLYRDIINYFKTERDLEIGVLAAEEILEFFMEEIGPHIYNKAVEDAKIVANQSFGDLEFNLDLLLNK